ncbi:hypothetical protein AHiyo8_37140 [Arthrobacter sp. Hiyo8]|nr:hypothetical protein AHiyo8_37140 [Arthrobacter sp. Hiyo8]
MNEPVGENACQVGPVATPGPANPDSPAEPIAPHSFTYCPSPGLRTQVIIDTWVARYASATARDTLCAPLVGYFTAPEFKAGSTLRWRSCT